MKLPISELEKIERKYGYLVNKDYDVDLKIGQARAILDVIYNHYKDNPDIQKEFADAMYEQQERFKKNKETKKWTPYEDPIKNSQDGWLNFFVLKDYIPSEFKNSFEFIYTEVSEPIHGRDGMDDIIYGTVARLNQIIKWVFDLHERPTEFLKPIKIQTEGNPVKTDIEPDSYNNERTTREEESSPKRNLWLKIAGALVLLLAGVLLYQQFWGSEPDDIEHSNIEQADIKTLDEDTKEEISKDSISSDAEVVTTPIKKPGETPGETIIIKKNCCQKVQDAANRLLVKMERESIGDISKNQLKSDIDNIIIGNTDCNRQDCNHALLFKRLFDKGNLFTQRLLKLEQAYYSSEQAEEMSPEAEANIEKLKATLKLLAYLCNHTDCTESQKNNIHQLQQLNS